MDWIGRDVDLGSVSIEEGIQIDTRNIEDLPLLESARVNLDEIFSELEEVLGPELAPAVVDSELVTELKDLITPTRSPSPFSLFTLGNSVFDLRAYVAGEEEVFNSLLNSTDTTEDPVHDTAVPIDWTKPGLKEVPDTQCSPGDHDQILPSTVTSSSSESAYNPPLEEVSAEPDWWTFVPPPVYLQGPEGAASEQVSLSVSNQSTPRRSSRNQKSRSSPHPYSPPASSGIATSKGGFLHDYTCVVCYATFAYQKSYLKHLRKAHLSTTTTS